MKTNMEKSKVWYDVDKTFTTTRILKNSTISIEIWSTKSDKIEFAKGDDLILRTEGDVDSFLKHPLRIGTHFDDGDNQIETMSFWQDEYE